MSKSCVVFVATALLQSSSAVSWRRQHRDRVGTAAGNHISLLSPSPKSSRVLLDASENPSLTEDEPLVYRYYEEDFSLNLYGLTELLSPADAQLLQEASKEHLNKRLYSSPVDLRVSSTRVLDQVKVENSIPILSVSLRILGQAVSTDAEAVAALSFEDEVLEIFADNPSEFSRALVEDSDVFDGLLVARASIPEHASATLGSADTDLAVLISASVGAAVLTALLLCFCLWRQKFCNKNSKAVNDMLKKDDGQDELDIASTWSSSDESSSKEAPKTPPKLRSFPTQERRTLSPCIEELAGVNEASVSA